MTACMLVADKAYLRQADFVTAAAGEGFIVYAALPAGIILT